jgi:hypothetical protein
MLKRMVLPTALLVSALGFTLVPSAAARDRDDYGRGRYENRFDNNYNRGGYGSHEAREWRERQERREREWREHERFERRYRAPGYYDRFGYWHRYGY